MPDRTEAVVTRIDGKPRLHWDDAVRGTLSWVTLFDRAVTPTDGLTAGVAELAAGEGGRSHRHAQPEIYYILEGTGLLTIDGVENPVSAGHAAFIPGNSWHSLRNTAETTVRLLYVFPADSLGDVVYEYAP